MPSRAATFRYLLTLLQVFNAKNIFNHMKIGAGLLLLATSFVVFGVLLILLLPSRVLRIKLCNYYGKTVGRAIVWLARCPVTVEGKEHLDRHRPAIYISNHTSMIDIFIAIWLSPVGTVGIAKKEVIYYPFFGQLYMISGHLRIDRGNSPKAIRSLQSLAGTVRANKLSIFLWPEGTRSRNGRLQPLKKGLYHLAVQTGLPVVPMVVLGAHKSWEKHSMHIHGVPILVKVLPPIDTSDWEELGPEKALAQVHGQFKETLPQEQKPLPAEDHPLR